jgi:hypothetical protein
MIFKKRLSFTAISDKYTIERIQLLNIFIKITIEIKELNFLTNLFVLHMNRYISGRFSDEKFSQILSNFIEITLLSYAINDMIEEIVIILEKYRMNCFKNFESLKSLAE